MLIRQLLRKCPDLLPGEDPTDPVVLKVLTDQVKSGVLDDESEQESDAVLRLAGWLSDPTNKESVLSLINRHRCRKIARLY
jgi:hypothetical protein